MAFIQAPPRLGNQYDDDPLLGEYLTRRLPKEMLREIEPELRHLGELAGGHLYQLQLDDRLNEPKLTGWDAWGNRVDRVELSPLWREAQVLAAKHGLVATAYERKHGELSRVHQMVLNYVVEPSLDVYSCPLAMTDGAARTLLALGNRPLCDRAIPRLTARDPARMWTSGQWMTERIGGSDVGLSETVARRGDDGVWRLYGNKFFTSAVQSEMALTLARPEGNGPGGRGLALFYLEFRRADGRANGITVHRLKEKLGTKKVPTAELELEGAEAVPVAGLGDGVKNITFMLNTTRTWNSLGAVAGARRAIALARDYAGRRVAFRAPLGDQPLHIDTLGTIEAELEGAFLLTFRLVELFGRQEAGCASDEEQRLLRLLTPIVKLVTGKQAVTIASEAIECCGGAGYMEDTGLPRLVRDAQVLPIWEGTTNVLSLDLLRAVAHEGSLLPLTKEIDQQLAGARDSACIETARRAVEHAVQWLGEAAADRPRLEAGARRLAMTLGRALELGLLANHAEWCRVQGKSRRALAAARCFAKNGIDLIVERPLDESRALAGGDPKGGNGAVHAAAVISASEPPASDRP